MTEPSTGNEIAIIGMSGRLPGAPDLASLWHNLREGVESVTRFRDDELESSPLLPPGLRAHPDFVPAGAVLDGADQFDHRFFGFSPREARWLDPQQRVLLQVAWTALEDAGIDPARTGDRIAVYAGAGSSAHLLSVLGEVADDPASQYQALGAATSDNLATRLAHALGLRGEAVTVHTACSTGLAAVHLACQSLLLGQSRLALAAAARVSLPQRTGYLWQEGMILSRDGHCRAFDHRASGTVAGNGAVAVLLKPLADALEDRDNVYAVIAGSALNNDGRRGAGYTAPSVAGQAEVIAEALAFAGVSADRIGYVEAHGTGTPLGDPIEIEALTRAYRRSSDRVADCPIGSVKTNLGHLDAAAGLAGLVKVALMLRHGEIPPSLHLERPSPAIDFAASPFVVNTALRPWPAGDRPRLAGVSSFGIGGTNVHAVLAEPPAPAPVDPSPRPYQLVTLCARSRPALARMATELAGQLAGQPAELADLADLGYTRALGRAELPYRRTQVAAGTAELVDALRGGVPEDPAADRPRIGWLFPGQGAARYGMAAALHAAEPAFRRALESCLAAIEPELGEPLLPVLCEGEGPIDDPRLAHPALFAVEYALARLWLDWGVRPAALLGHSFGEYAAACLAGVLSLPDAAGLAVTRGRLVARLPEGRMLAVGLGEPELAGFLTGEPLSLAAVNGAERCVVSGGPAAVERLRQRLRQAGHAAVLLPVRHAFHSPAVEPVLAELTAAGDDRRHADPRLPLLSTLTGDWWEAGGGDYWARQMRQPVRFAAALERLAGEDETPLVLLEVGPDQALTALARDQLGKRAVVVPSLRAARAGVPDHRVLLSGLGTLWRAGVPVDWRSFYAGERRRRLPLPGYPFAATPVPAVAAPRAAEQTAGSAAYPPADSGPDGTHPDGADPAGPEAGGAGDDLERRVLAIWRERLGSDEIGPHDNFLEVGGNSLIAAQLLTRLRAEFGVPVPLAALFEAPTVAGLAERIRELTGPSTAASTTDSPTGVPAGRPVAALPPVRRLPASGPVPLSAVQERTLALHAADPANPALAMPVAVDLAGELDLPLLRRSVRAVIDRHETLRTSFHRDPKGGWQARIDAAGPLTLSPEPVADLPAAQRIAREEPTRPFDLAVSPVRVRLLRLAADRHILLLTLHHVVSDTLSLVITVREIAACYRAFHAGEPSPLPPLPVRYADFAGWQRTQLAGPAMEPQREYWRRQMADPPGRPALPTDRPRAAEAGTRGSQLPVRLPEPLAAELVGFSQRLGVTPFVTLLAGYAALLGRVTGAEDLVIGTPLGNRDRPELEPLVGYVAHAVPLRVDLRGDPRFVDLLRQLHGTLLAAHAHPDLPYEQLAAVGADRRLFDAVFVLHADLPREQPLPGMTWRVFEVPEAPAMFGATLAALTLMLSGSPAGFAGTIGYADELFTPETARRLFDQFAALLDDALRRPETRVGELRPAAPPSAPSAIGVSGPAAPQAPPAEQAVAGLLAADRERGDQPALVWPGGRLTWRELAARSAPEPAPAGAHDPAGAAEPAGGVPAGGVSAVISALASLRAGRPVRLGGRTRPAAEVAAGLASLTATLPAGHGTVLAAGTPRSGTGQLDLLWALGTGRPVRIVEAGLPGWLPEQSRAPAALQLSLSYFANDEDALAGPKYQLLIEGARLADRLGFTAIWTPERHFHSFGGLYPNPTATSAGLATATDRIGIRAGSVVLPLHDPIRVAEDWAVIDNLSGGRVGVSFASGWHPDDFVLAPDRFGQRRELLREGIETVRRLWRGEPVERPNGLGEPVPVRIRPRPVQPELPFWLTAAGSPATFRAAGQAGGYLLTNLMAQSLPALAEKIGIYREAWRHAGHDGEGHVTLMLHAFLAGDTRQAYATAREPLLRYFRSSVDIARGFAVAQGLAVRPEDLSEQDITTLLEHGLERYLRDGGLFGTPADCAPVLERVRGLGVDEVAALVDYGTSTEDTLASVRLLGELVTAERERAGAAAAVAAAGLAGAVTALAGQIRADDVDCVLAGADQLAWLAERVPAALRDRTVLVDRDDPGGGTADGLTGGGTDSGSGGTDGGGTAGGGAVAAAAGGVYPRFVATPAPAGDRLAAHARDDGGPELVVRPGPGSRAAVRDPAGEPLGVGVVGELTLADAPTGQRARWRADGGLDLLPGPAPRPAQLPLSFSQQRIWSLEQLVPGNIAYNNTVALRMRGRLDTDALQRALTEVVRRHEVLRASFHATGDGPVQVVQPRLAVPLPVSHAAPDDVDSLARAHARQPYQLDRGPLLRARLLRMDDSDHVLLIGMHHIVSDGWSAGVLFAELGSLYAAYAAGSPSPLPPLAWQYPDYAAAQRQRPEPERFGAELDYWRRQLAELPLLELPTDRPRPPVQGQHGARAPVHIDRELTDAVHALCRRTGVTPFMVLQAALTGLLHRYTGQTDLAIGTAVAGRHRPETEALVGVFINTVVLRTDLSGDPSFAALLERVRGTVLDALAHQELPFERLVDELGVPRDLSHAPLVQAMLVLHNTPAPRLELAGLTLESMEVDPGTSKLDLTLELREGPAGIHGGFEYDTDLFDPETMAQLAEHLTVLLRGALAGPDRPISTLELLGAAERTRLVALGTGARPPRGTAEPVETVSAAFAAQAARTPEAVAVGDPTHPLTYRTLDARADQLAQALRRLGVRPGQRVALLLEPATEAMTGMLAVLKAGGAYVPLDPRAPAARLAELVGQAAPVVVLATDPARHGDNFAGAPVHDPAGLRADQPARPVPPLAGPADPAYVVFTSGSTGRPKGVVVEHRQLLAVTRARRAQYGPDAGACLCLYPLFFDGSIGWVYYALLTGGTLFAPAPEQAAEPDRLADLVQRHQIARIASVPGYYARLLAAVPATLLGSLRTATVGGESCPPELVRGHREALPDTVLYNEYGPTETTVYCTAHQVGRVAGRVPIGTPIGGTTAYVLDRAGELCPAGAAGELHVGGAGVARGYLDDPVLTARRFVPDRFGDPAGRLYRTGDRVRWNRDGGLEFLGRLDRQVKVRGYRVETAEIETALLAHPAVAEAAVVPVGGRLVGYLVPADGAGPSPEDVRTAVRTRLPEYLVPAQLVSVAALPRTRAGKLAVDALPAPQPASGGGPVPPRDPREATLRELVAGVLDLDPATVGVHDDFFGLGGDSILAIALVTRARERDLAVTVRQLFQNPTVAALATVANTRLAVPAEQGPVAGPVPLTPVQRWFFDQEQPEPWHWNMAVALELTGPVHAEALAAAFRAVIGHHDALRLRFVRQAGQWRAHNAGQEPSWRLRRTDLSTVPADRRAAALAACGAQLHASLRLATGPLLRAALVGQGPGRPQRLLVVAHHLVVDGVSWRILLEDLFTAYRQLLAGRPVTLPAKTTSYQQWARRLAGYGGSPAATAERDYWRGLPYQLADRLPVPAAGTEAELRQHRVTLEPATTAALLRELPRRHGTDLHTALLAAVTRAVAGWSGAHHLRLDVERHGREDLLPELDISRTVGWFSDLHPLVLPAVPGAAEQLAAVAARLRDLPHHGAGYLPLRYGGDLPEPPAAALTVNYLGQLDAVVPAAAPARLLDELPGPLRAASTRRPYPLELTAGILRGRLFLIWSYPDGRLAATAAGLAGQTLAALRELVA